MRDLIAAQPLAGMDLRGGLVLLGFVLGFAVKTPLVPLHSWLPPAHVDAPGPASAILAGVLLKMGTYGLVRIPLSMMSETFARYALAIGVTAVISILWGALVAFAQRDLQRSIASTDRQSVVSGKSVYVRVALCGRRSIKEYIRTTVRS